MWLLAKRRMFSQLLLGRAGSLLRLHIEGAGMIEQLCQIDPRAIMVGLGAVCALLLAGVVLLLGRLVPQPRAWGAYVDDDED